MGRGGKREGAGRPKGVVSEAKKQLSEMAKVHGKTALNVLVEVATNDAEPATSRVSAAVALLDRGYGRPQQSMDLSNEDGSLTARPDNEIEAEIAAIQRKLGETDGGAGA